MESAAACCYALEWMEKLNLSQALIHLAFGWSQAKTIQRRLQKNTLFNDISSAFLESQAVEILSLIISSLG